MFQIHIPSKNLLNFKLCDYIAPSYSHLCFWPKLIVTCCFASIFQYLTDLWLMVGLGSRSFLAPGLVKVVEKIFSRPKVRLEDTKSPGTSFNSWLPHKVIIVPETRWKRNAKISQTLQRRWRSLARVASKLVRRSGKLVMVSKAVTIGSFWWIW